MGKGKRAAARTLVQRLPAPLRGLEVEHRLVERGLVLQQRRHRVQQLRRRRQRRGAVVLHVDQPGVAAVGVVVLVIDAAEALGVRDLLVQRHVVLDQPASVAPPHVAAQEVAGAK